MRARAVARPGEVPGEPRQAVAVAGLPAAERVQAFRDRLEHVLEHVGCVFRRKLRAPATYAIKIEKTGFDAYTTKIQLPADGELKVEANLSRKSAECGTLLPTAKRLDTMSADHNSHFYEPAKGHGLPHDPFNAMVGPRPIGWISSQNAQGHLNLAPYSFFNAFNYTPPIIGFASIGAKDSLHNIRETGEFCWNLATRPLAEQIVD